MFKLKCKFSPTPGIRIIFQRTFAQRSMQTPDRIGRTIEFEIHSVKIVGFENNNVLIILLSFVCSIVSGKAGVMAHSHCAGPGMGTMSLYLMPLSVHTTPRLGMGQGMGLGTNGLHTYFPVPSSGPRPFPVSVLCSVYEPQEPEWLIFCACAAQFSHLIVKNTIPQQLVTH